MIKPAFQGHSPVPLRAATRWLLVSLWSAALPAAAACSGGDGGTVQVLAQGRFQAEVPSGWQVVIPRDNPDDEEPVFAAGPEGGDSGLAVFFSESDDAATALRERSAKLDAQLAAPEERREEGRFELMASGTQQDRASGRQLTIVVAAIHLDAAQGTPVVVCALGDLSRDACERFVRSLSPAGE